MKDVVVFISSNALESMNYSAVNYVRQLGYEVAVVVDYDYGKELDYVDYTI